MEFLSDDVECPHCGEWEDKVPVEFDEEEFDHFGGQSPIQKCVCDNCGEEFYFNASLRFEVEVLEIWKEKPK